MRWHRVVQHAACWGLLACGGTAGAAEPNPLAGWFGAFPELPGYQRTFQSPRANGKGKAAVYGQTARYEWTGGAVKVLEVTLARDPAFAQRHAGDALRKQAPPPKEVRIGKRTAWAWDTNPPRLLVPLAGDKALTLEGKGAGPWEDLASLAGRFDLTRAEKALDRPPRTSFARSLEAFRALPKGASPGDVEAWLGPADDAAKTDPPVLIYHLADGGRVLLGLAKDRTVRSVRHEGKDGKTDELLKE